MILTYQTYKTLFILILMSDATVFINARTGNLNEGGVCRTSDGSLGRCVNIESCTKLNQLLQSIRLNRAPQGSIELLRANICQVKPTKLLVCCKSRTPPAPVSKCGKSSLVQKVIGGVNAKLFAWPWMALIQTKLNGRVSFTCGGVLISDRFVLTAAHCTASNPALRGVTILFVRLGEYDLKHDPDCKDNVCSENQDAFVGDVIVHPEYNKNQYCKNCHDIALIRLLDPITPNVLGIYPICIPTHFEQQLSVDPTNLQTSNKLAYIAGWGSVNKDPYTVTLPDILQEAEIPIQLTDYCTNSLRSFEPNTVFCAGGTDSDSADSCRGDSGGPIMMRGKNGNENAWYVIGIVSRGPTVCGAQGTQSIFTNVSYYMPWILENMKI